MARSTKTSPKAPTALCPSCHVGHLSNIRSTYTQWHEGELIVVPNVPAQTCDYCDELHFHPVVLERLQQLLWTDTGRQSSLGPPRPLHVAERKSIAPKPDL